MVKSKPSLPPEVNELNNYTDGNKVKASKPNKYRGNNLRNMTVPEPKSDTCFKGRYTDLKGYIFDLGPIASDKLF